MLRGWKQIGAYFGVSYRTANRWAKLYGMPFKKDGHLVYIEEEDADAWAQQFKHGTKRVRVWRDHPSGESEKKISTGYIHEWCPTHPREESGWVPQHIVIAEEHYQRQVVRGLVVHHINKVKDDNRPENLQIMTESEHSKLHGNERKLSA